MLLLFGRLASLRADLQVFGDSLLPSCQGVSAYSSVPGESKQTQFFTLFSKQLLARSETGSYQLDRQKHWV